MSTMKDMKGLIEEMMKNFKSEPDLPKEPKPKEVSDQDPEATVPKPKSKSTPKAPQKSKPRQVAAPAVPRRSAPGSCLILSALLGALRLSLIHI